jgi:histidine triad (HIT) family protein
MPETPCVFCEIVAGTAPATIVREWPLAIAFVPIDPVCDGHVLVVPRYHVADATTQPDVTADTMRRAAELAAEHGASNILTSIGAAATQSIFHLHIHVVPRKKADRLMLPWGTTGNPHDPHLCHGMEVLRAEREEAMRELTEARQGDWRNEEPNNPPCPRCGSTHVISPMARLPWRRGQWWRCFGCFHRWSTALDAQESPAAAR